MTPAEKVQLIRGYAGRYPGLRVFIETGLWQGTGSWEGVRDLFETTIVVDLQESNVEAAEKKGVGFGLVGDSGRALPGLLRQIDRPALFWLDAHLMEEYDAEGDACPLLAELDAIVHWKYGAGSLILIDDMRLMDGGRAGYPTREQIDQVVSGVGWPREETDDILALLP